MPAIVTAPRKVSESPTRMTRVGMERRSCVRDIVEFNLQSLAMDGIKRRGKRKILWLDDEVPLRRGKWEELILKEDVEFGLGTRSLFFYDSFVEIIIPIIYT